MIYAEAVHFNVPTTSEDNIYPLGRASSVTLESNSTVMAAGRTEVTTNDASIQRGSFLFNNLLKSELHKQPLYRKMKIMALTMILVS